MQVQLNSSGSSKFYPQVDRHSKIQSNLQFNPDCPFKVLLIVLHCFKFIACGTLDCASLVLHKSLNTSVMKCYFRIIADVTMPVKKRLLPDKSEVSGVVTEETQGGRECGQTDTWNGDNGPVKYQQQ